MIDSVKFCDALRGMLPDGVCVAAGPLCTTELSFRESASLGVADRNRLREFASGRAYAKQALATLGICDVELPIAPNRAPEWPRGVVGSISHVRHTGNETLVAAAVARVGSARAIGIDVEAEDCFQPQLWPYALTEQELARLLALPVPTRRSEAQFIWCAKEATAKIIGQPFDPSAIEIERDRHTGDFVAKSVDGQSCLPGNWRGRTSRFDELLIATAMVPAGDRTSSPRPLKSAAPSIS